MLLFIFNFAEELILSITIMLGLLICSFTKKQQKFIGDVYYQKKLFFILCHTIFFILGITFSITLYSFNQVNDQIFPFIDSLTTLEFYNAALIDSYGNCFFRKDFLVLFFNLILNFLVFFYLILFYEYCKNTTIVLKYFFVIPILIITVFLGFKIFLVAYDLLLIVLALELTAFCSVILISLQITTSSNNIFPLEAAIKYFIFNALAISLLLFAISGYYSFFKTLNLLDYTSYILFAPELCFDHLETLLVLNLFFFSAYLLKLGAAPFHQWVPDVYEGSELVITAFLVLIVGPALNFKFFVFIKILLPVFEQNSLIFSFFIFSGIVSIILGTFNAFNQFKIKRFLAYTGITHLGYMLLSFGTATFLGIFASFFYLMFYILTNLAFFTIILLTQRISGIKLLFMNHFKLLLNDNILVFLLFLIPIFSFAGIPPFAGFFSKFFMFLALIEINKNFLAITLIFYVLISAYLYLRFIKISIFEEQRLKVFLPLQQMVYTNFSSPQNSTITYYKFENRLKNQSWFFTYQNFILFILFLINCLLLFFIFFLPVICLSFLKPLLTLFLFF